MAIQWHIWLHLGLSRDGASGSVRATVSWMPEFSRSRWSLLAMEKEGEEKGTVSRKCTTGSFLAFLGLMVLPRSAVAFFQVALRVRRGTGWGRVSISGLVHNICIYVGRRCDLPKGSRMAGMMCAFSSLWN